jgi:hypothetical protein
MLKLLIPVIIILGLAVLGIAIKMFFIKDAQFKKTCSSVDIGNGQKVGCSCTSTVHEECKNYKEHHG